MNTPLLSRILLTSALCLSASSATAQVTWTGDFESGDFTQFNNQLNGDVDGKRYLTVQEDIVLQGSKAAKVELHNDAEWSNGLKRVELNHRPKDGLTSEGSKIFFAWSFYLPKALPTDPSAQIGYWESGNSYKQMMAITIAGEDIRFDTRQPENKRQWEGKGLATPGSWHRIAMSIVWSKDANKGRVSLWFDGKKVVDQQSARTLNDDNAHFVQIGLLRGKVEFDDVPVIYLDDAVEGKDLADVRVELPPPPDPMEDMAMNTEKDMATTKDPEADMGASALDMTTAASDLGATGTDDMTQPPPGVKPDMSGTATTATPDPETPGYGKQSYNGCGQVGAGGGPLAGFWTFGMLLCGITVRRRRRQSVSGRKSISGLRHV